MTRPQEITELRRRYAQAVQANKRKLASIIHAKLCALMTRELRAENRKERKAA